MMEEILNVLIQQFEIYWDLALNTRSHIHANVFNSYFFICYFAATRPILDPCQEDNLTHPILNTVFLLIVLVKGH